MSLFTDILNRPLSSEQSRKPASVSEFQVCPDTGLRFTEINGDKYILKTDLIPYVSAEGRSVVLNVGGPAPSAALDDVIEVTQERVVRVAAIEEVGEASLADIQQVEENQRQDRVSAIEEAGDISLAEVRRLSGGVDLDTISPDDLCG